MSLLAESTLATGFIILGRNGLAVLSPLDLEPNLETPFSPLVLAVLQLQGRNRLTVTLMGK